MRILCLDYGDVRIGVAVSDPMGWTAQPVETIQWRFDVSKPIARISALAAQYDCRVFLIGLPRNMDGSTGFREDKTLEFIAAMKQTIPDADIRRWDERLTTVMAQKALHSMGVESRKQKGKLDQVAAVMILQGYLDAGCPMPKETTTDPET